MHHKEAPTASPEQCLHDILDVVACIRNGHFTARLHETMPGDAGATAKLFNELMDLLTAFGSEHLRLMEEIGVTGRFGGQMAIPECTGAWREMADATNRMGANMTAQYRDGCNVVRAHLAGDTKARMTAGFIAGECRELKEQLNALLQRTGQRRPAGV